MYSVSDITGRLVLASVNRENIAGYVGANIDSDKTERGEASVIDRAVRKFEQSAANIGLNLGTTSATNTALINSALVLYVAAEFSRMGLPKVAEDCKQGEIDYRNSWLTQACTLLEETQTGMAEATGVCELAKGDDLPDVFTSTLYEQR